MIDISVDWWGGTGGGENAVVRVSSGDNMLQEDWITREEIEEMTVKLIHGGILYGLCRHEEIDKLIQLDIIDKDDLRDWMTKNIRDLF